MFSWLNKMGVRSDTGFEVQAIDRYTMEYREGIRKITVDTEDGITKAGHPCIIIGPSAFSRWDDNGELPYEKRQEILGNFRDALEFQGLKLTIE